MMTNLLHGAHVANKLFSTIARLRLLLVMFLTLTVSAEALGAETETLKWTNYTSSGSGATLTITWTGNTSCQVTQSKGDNTSNNVSTSYATSPRWYQYHHVTFTPQTGCTITKVVLTGSSASYNGQEISFVTGTGSISKSNNTTTITGSWTSAFKLKMGKQFRPGTVVVTYETSGSGSTTVDPEVTFSNGEYTIGGAALDLSTLWESNSTGAVTYSVTNANGTGATINGTSFTATAAGSCTVRATQAATASHNTITKTATITVSAPASGGGDGDCDRWVEVSLSDIQSTDDVVITMEKSNLIYALTYNSATATSKAPPATLITNDNLKTNSGIANTLRWNVSNSNGNLTIYPTGSISTWLYCTNTNNGVRVGTNENKAFTIDNSSGYLKHTGTSRYIGVYFNQDTGNAQDWRCYTSTTSNISGQTLKFYKYVECTTEPTVFVIPKCGGDGGGTWLVVIEWFATF